MNFGSSLIHNEIKKYEEFIKRNPDSPLLVRLAWLYLEAGNVDKAMSLCSKALRKYPDYLTAHLVMAKCYIKTKSYLKAIKELNQVVEILPDSKFLTDLISKISLKQKREEFPQKEKITTMEATLPTVEPLVIEPPEPTKFKSEDDSLKDIFELPQIEYSQKETTIDASTSYLNELIKQIEAAKTRTPQGESKPVANETLTKTEEELSYEDINIVTPALAEILANQGAYEEAIKIYKKLIEQRPLEKEKYEKEIEKLQEKIAK